ncbi:MAG: restriction endonuclease subunit S [Anaerolineae bacterium]|nr:restriction endonuclease subunit S [Anaerolineae bacterium]
MDEQDQNQQLPTSWALTTLGEIQLDTSRSILPSDTPSKMFELYSVPNFVEGKPEIVSGAEIGSNKKTVQVETVLLCGINPRINRVWIVGDFSPHTKIASTEWRQFAKQEGIDPKYLKYFMQTNSFRDFLASNASGVGGSLMRVQNSAFASYPFPVPPLPEQHRIVAKIEQLFSDLDAGVAALENAKQQLKRYRQSVLQSAVTGKLTADWRAAHQHELEPASTLLARIRAERKEKRNDKHKEVSSLNTSELEEPPEGWEWATIGEIAKSMKNGIYKEKEYYDHVGIACLRMYNIDNNGRIVWKDIKRMRLAKSEIEEYLLLPGDILVNRVNSRELVGKAAPIPKGLEDCVYESKNIRLRLWSDSFESGYVSYWFQSKGQAYFSFNAQQVVGMASINQVQLAAMPILIPSPIEQVKIVAEVERRLSVADQIEKTIDASLLQSERLRQSILKKAFSGNLVPQDPTDEPAEKLLERIRANREKQPNGKTKQLPLLNDTPKKKRRNTT